MDLINYLSAEEWQIAEGGNLEGFDEYRIIRRASEGQGKYKYSAFDPKKELPVELHITGASESRDPLKEIQVINLRVDGNKYITGINDNGDCVVRK
ncbi:hypothetical protein pdam_00017988 [Pocillopora damicornis]|uniref:Uncharacterized protein n=2 Tax=Pocillopora TaxID=46730 RepID=A0A3M6V3A6_POCDA|nr:hypothetical protein pdam_00017988 [Pocillopora damicornis]CAH3112252.1 unnamed protein product [Pocillopora meandrina]